MIEFIHPWCFSLLPLPYLVYRFVPAYKTRQFAYRVPFFDVLVDVFGLQANKGATQLTASRWQRLMLLSGWVLLVIALSKPVMLGEEQTREVQGRDLMFLLDLSGSMAEKDFSTPEKQDISRLDAAKEVLLGLIKQRNSDRLGLILFGDSAVLQSPFTADHQAFRQLLLETQVAMVGETTHLGDAIGLGIKTFIDEREAYHDETVTEQEKVMIVLTDGNDTHSLLPPNEAGKLAKANGIRIHMVAMGSPDAEQAEQESVNMTVIEELAKVTGGQAFLALSPSELARIYQTISSLEGEVFESYSFRPKTSIHHLPILVLMLNYLLMVSFYSVKTVGSVPRSKEKGNA